MIAIWIVCTLAAALWAARCPPPETPYRRRVLIAAAAFGPCLVAIQVALRLAARANPYQYDQFLYAVDGCFGFQASFFLGRCFRRWPLLSLVCTGAYDGLHIAILTVLLRHAWKDPSWRFARALIADFLIAYCLFYLLPAAGPLYGFAGNYPDQAPRLAAPALVKLFAFPNAMPSVHFSAALLLFWNARVFRFGRPVFAVYLLLVALATLGTGEHYLIDLVVALPYALLVQSIGLGRISWSAGVLVLGWILSLRFWPGIFVHVPLLLWGLTVFTVAYWLRAAGSGFRR
jgi:hypothetical protein